MEPNLPHREQLREQHERLAELREAVQKLKAEPFLSQTVLIDRLPGEGQIPPVEKPVWFLVERYASRGRLPVEASLDDIAVCKAYLKALHRYRSYERRLASDRSSVRQGRNKVAAPSTFFGGIRNLFRGIGDVFTFWISIVMFLMPTEFIAAVLFLIGLILVIILFF